MIIRLYPTNETSLVRERVPAPGGGEFGTINVLALTSIELRQRFGLTLADTDVASAFELVRSLTKLETGPTNARIRKARLARLIDARPALLPCFIAYQETPKGSMLPLMTDGPEGRWSLFFEEDGAMTLAEFQGGHWRITPESELLPEAAQKADPIAETKSFLLNSIRTAKAKLVGSGDRS
jgi:hypothetical protein